MASASPGHGFLNIHPHPLTRQVSAKDIIARAGVKSVSWSNTCGQALRREVQGVVARALDDVPISQPARRSLVEGLVTELSIRSPKAIGSGVEWSGGQIACRRAEDISRRDVENVVSRVVDDIPSSQHVVGRLISGLHKRSPGPVGQDWSTGQLDCSRFLRRDVEDAVSRAVSASDVPRSPLAQRDVVDTIVARLSTRSPVLAMDWSQGCKRAGSILRRDIEDVVSSSVQSSKLRGRSTGDDSVLHRDFVKRLADGILSTI